MRTPASSYFRQAAFTLLEVMVALGIFSLLAIGSYHLLRSETHSQQQLKASSNRLNHWQRGLNKMGSDLLQITRRGVRDEYGQSQAAFIGTHEELRFTHGGWSNPQDRPRSELQRVHYGLAVDDDGNRILRRSYWQHLDRAPGSEPIQQTLITDIEAFEIRYFDGHRQQWLDEWPAKHQLGANDSDTTPDDPPQAIEITLTSPHYGTIQRVWALNDRAPSP